MNELLRNRIRKLESKIDPGKKVKFRWSGDDEANEEDAITIGWIEDCGSGGPLITERFDPTTSPQNDYGKGDIAPILPDLDKGKGIALSEWKKSIVGQITPLDAEISQELERLRAGGVSDQEIERAVQEIAPETEKSELMMLLGRKVGFKFDIDEG